VNGVLCFEQYDRYTPPCLNLSKIAICPGLLEFFRILLRYFHVGVWSCMQPYRLKKVLNFLLPEKLRSQLLFVYGRNKCSWPQHYPFCNKLISRLSSDMKTKRVCLPDRVLMVDDQPRRHAYNGNMTCYFPRPWNGELTLPNQGNVIPNISTALLPFILGLRKYDSVTEFLKANVMDGKHKRRFLEPWHIR
jgi:hypothetical protein